LSSLDSLALHAALFSTKEHADTGKTAILSHGQPLNEFNVTETEAGKPGKRQSCRMGDGLVGVGCVFVSLAQRRCGNPAEWATACLPLTERLYDRANKTTAG
jgi:hypothetical protein